MQLIYGDATQPQGSGNIFIAHICNNLGAWGVGFTKALSERWKKPEWYYRRIRKYTLGEIQKVRVENNIWVINMIAQKGLGRKNKPLDYGALNKCLEKLNEEALLENAIVHMPKIGTGLGGGDWAVISNMIKFNLNCEVIVYEF